MSRFLVTSTTTLMLAGIACSSAEESAPAPVDVETGLTDAGPPPVTAPEERDGGTDASDAAGPTRVTAVKEIYGTSFGGLPLVDHRITPKGGNGKKALLTFAIHGFEDAWDQDGRALYAIAELAIAHYTAHPEELSGWSLVVVPTANPDGMYNGVNNFRQEKANAYGRCTAQHKDLNRNFSTGSFAENEALRGLTENVKPSVVIDFHGWYNCYYGSSRVGRYFADAFNAKYPGKPARYCFTSSTGAMDCGNALGGVFHENTTITDDLFAEWASSVKGIPSALVEYPAPDFDLDGKVDAAYDPALGYTRISDRLRDLLWDRTKVALNALFSSF